MGYTNEQVINSWTWGKPCISSNSNLKTDGLNLYSYDMKIGATVYGENLPRTGKKLGLLAYGYSPTTTKHVYEFVGKAGIELVKPVRVENVNYVTIGWNRKTTKTYWLFFPHEVEAMQAQIENERSE